MNEVMQYWNCYITTILKLKEFASLGWIVQKRVFCCI